MTSWNLTKRDIAHRDLGHWHFKSYSNTPDFAWLPRTISLDHCNKLIEWATPKLVEMKPFSPQVYLKNKFTSEEQKQDNNDIYDSLDGKVIDYTKGWFGTIYPEIVDQGWINDIVEHDLGIKVYGAVTTDYRPSDAAVRFAIQSPGGMTLTHIDHFYDYSNRADRYADPGERKAIVFLSDRQSGQYFAMGNNFINDWKAGQSLTWDWGVPHYTINTSNQFRFNLMISIKLCDNPHIKYEFGKTPEVSL